MQKYSFPKNKIKVLLLENVDEIAVSNFENEGYSVEVITKALSEDELIRKVKNVFLLGIRSKTQISKKVLDSADKLLSVGAFCIVGCGVNLGDVST